MGVIFRATGREILFFERAKRLAAGIYAWVDQEEARKIEDAGSAVLVAPDLGLTAKHVPASFRRLDDQFGSRAKRKTVFDDPYKFVETAVEYGSMVYQVAKTEHPVEEEDRVLWHPVVTWESLDTDIACLELRPRTKAAEKQKTEIKYLDWQLLPPPVGAIVSIYGFPDPDIQTEGVEHIAAVDLIQHNAKVVEHVSPMQAHGFGEFPAFRLHRSFPHGFSGAAIIYNEKLVGIFSGPDLVACLWPLALIEYTPSDGARRSFADYFDSGFITAVDWDEVKGRPMYLPCEEALAGSEVTSRCDRRHPVLTRR